MRSMAKLFVTCTFAVLLLAPTSARADGFLVPWLGGNAGHDVGGFADYGVSVGKTAASVFDFDIDAGYSPNFFGDPYSSHVLTLMGNATLGIPFGSVHTPRFRP